MRMEDAIEARLGFFRDRGDLEKLPTPWQLKAGWFVMLPVTLGESRREREKSRTTLLSQVPIRVPLQVLYNPRQVMADTGIDQRADQLVKHLLSVFHEDAFLGYDLQLLQSHPGGLALLAKEAADVAEGRSLWAPALKQMVSWPGYHAHLVELAQAAERNELPDPLDLDPRFCTLVGFAKYCCTMPDWPAPEFYGFDWKRFSKWWR